MADSCEHGDETSGSIKGEEFLDQPSDYYLLKDSALWSELFVSVVCKHVTGLFPGNAGKSGTLCSRQRGKNPPRAVGGDFKHSRHSNIIYEVT
jgi:hypothetical protein